MNIALRVSRVNRKIERDMREKNKKLQMLQNDSKMKEESYVDKDRQIAVRIGKKMVKNVWVSFSTICISLLLLFWF